MGQAAAFWTAAEYKKQMQIASDWLQKAILALSLGVSAQTKEQVSRVVDKVQLLPQMNEKLDAIDDKVDQASCLFVYLCTYASISPSIQMSISGCLCIYIDV